MGGCGGYGTYTSYLLLRSRLVKPSHVGNSTFHRVNSCEYSRTFADVPRVVLENHAPISQNYGQVLLISTVHTEINNH